MGRPEEHLFAYFPPQNHPYEAFMKKLSWILIISWMGLSIWMVSLVFSELHEFHIQLTRLAPYVFTPNLDNLLLFIFELIVLTVVFIFSNYVDLTREGSKYILLVLIVPSYLAYASFCDYLVMSYISVRATDQKYSVCFAVKNQSRGFIAHRFVLATGKENCKNVTHLKYKSADIIKEGINSLVLQEERN